MTHRSDESMWTNHHMVTNSHLANVQDGKIVVAGEIVPDMNILPSVAVEILCNPHPLSYGAEHLL